MKRTGAADTAHDVVVASPIQLRTIEEGWWLHCGGSRGFAEMGAHDDEELGEFEGFAEEEAGLEAHTMELPIVAAGDDDDGGVAGSVVPAQDFEEGGAVEVGEADVEEDEVWVKRRYGATGDVAVGEEGELPVGKVFEGVTKEFGEFGVVFNDGDAPGG